LQQVLAGAEDVGNLWLNLSASMSANPVTNAYSDIPNLVDVSTMLS